MLRRRCLAGLGALLCLPSGLRAGQAAPTELPGMPELRLQGQAQMRFFGLLIYDIRLWVREPVDAQNWATQDLVLELQYARSLSGQEIAKRSLAEMRRQSEIEAARGRQWLSEMEAAFPDVRAGDRLTGRYEPGRGAQFFVNGSLGRHIADAEFARLFFGIWLSAQSSEPRLREQLFGGGP